MGLDNGICVMRAKETKKIEHKLGKFSDDYSYDFDFAYWRKCWNVRELILNVLGGEKDYCTDYVVSLEDLKIIIKILKSFNKYNWNLAYNNNYTIWSWKTYKSANKKHIRQLKYLYKLKKKYPWIIIYFYDSY